MCWAVSIFGGGAYALLLMRECRDDAAGVLVVLVVLLTLVGGVVAVVRGRSTRSVVARTLAVAIAAYALAVGYCNWPSAAERKATRELLEAAEARRAANAPADPAGVGKGASR